jgi:uncharacterized protein DUF4389
VTAYSPYQAYPGPAPVHSAPPPILVAVADRAPQRRVTVFFRLLLAVPHLFVLYWLNFAGLFVGFIGWWGALFTGRLPQFAVTYLSGVLHWSTRVHAYCFLLTDVYPPFSLDDEPGYPVRVAIPEPQRLNRAAVFFRYFLCFPAGILGNLVMGGASTLFALIAWLIVLFARQLPPSFYLAYVGVVQYTARYYGFFWMLTPAYPTGLYGDRPGAVAWADQPSAAQAPGFGTPEPGYGIPGGYGMPVSGYGAPVGYGAHGEYGVRPAFQPTTWLLSLTTEAKEWTTAFIAIGGLILIGYAAARVRTINSATRTDAAIAATTQLNSSYDTLSNNLDTWQQASINCDKNLTCVTGQDTKAASAFGTFAAQVADTPVPADATADKARLVAAATAAQQDFIQLSQTTSASQYQSTITRSGLEQTLDDVDQDVTALNKDLQDQLSS